MSNPSIRVSPLLVHVLARETAKYGMTRDDMILWALHHLSSCAFGSPSGPETRAARAAAKEWSFGSGPLATEAPR